MDPVAGQAGAVRPLYRRADVVVTVRTLSVSGRHYPVSALADLRTSRGGVDPSIWWMAVLSGAVLAAFGVAVGLARDPAGPGRITYVLLGLAVLGPAAVGLIVRRRARRRRELWGDYRGEAQLLYASTDPREFGRVARALLRAVEAGR
jgi:hypothetical protein